MKTWSLGFLAMLLAWCGGPITAPAQIKDPLTLVCPTNLIVWTCQPTPAAVTFPDPTIGGSCAASTKVVFEPPSGSVFPPGTNQVVATALNSCGESNRCEFNVIVLRDTEPPVLQCPTNLVVWTCRRDGAVVNYPLPGVSDNADPAPTVTGTPPPGSFFPVGETVVTCKATDACGNVAEGTFTVTVRVDNLPPIVQCPADITVSTCDTSGRTVNFPPPEAADNSGEVSVVCTPPSGSHFPVGTTTVTCVAVDRCNNRTECSFKVTVLVDTTPPAIQCSTNIVVDSCNPSGTRVFYNPPTVVDNYDINPATHCQPPSGSMFPVGVTVVTCEATDYCGNRSTCSFTVTVRPDTTLPALDRNQSGLGDIWETSFQTGRLLPWEDDDGDGVNNADEAAAGTDPLDPKSVFALHSLEINREQNRFQLHWPGVRHKVYQAQATHEPGAPWQDVNALLPGLNGWMFTRISMDDTNLPQPQPGNTFFRLRVGDVDEDGDGLTAWEEAIIGTSDRTPDTQGIPGGDHAVADAWLVANGYGPGRLREVALAHVGGTPEGPTQTRLVTAAGTGGWFKLSSWGVDYGTVQPVHLQDTPQMDGWLVQLHVLTPELSPNLTLNPFVSGRLRTGENIWFSVFSLAEDGTLTEHDAIGYGNNASFFVRDYAMAHRSLARTSTGDAQYQLVTPLLGVNTGNQPQMRVLTWRVNADTGDLTATYDSGNVGVPNVPANGGRIQIAHQEGSRFVVSFADSNLVLSTWFFDVNEAGVASLRGGESSGLPLRGGTNVVSVPADDFALASLNRAGFMTALLDANCAPKLVTWEDRVVAFDPAAYSRPFYITDNTVDQSPTERGVLLDPPVVTHSREENFEANERFGAALAIGDFDGDGHEDVAIGVPAQSNGGAVTVMYGSASGLNGSFRDQHWTQDSEGIAGEGETGDTFGEALAAGDFNGDGFMDLAIGAPTEDLTGADGAGVVHVLYGSASGLRAAGSQLWMQGSDGLPDSPEANDWFGRSLTTGDFNNDGFADLAIGVYHESINGHADAGAVHVIYGSASGLSAAAGPGDQFLHQDLAWMENQAEASDNFGLPLASGDINGDGFADLVVGVAGEDFGATVNVGGVQVIYGSAAGLGPQNQFLRQGLIEPENHVFPGNPEIGDSFGWSLAVGDFNNDGFDDVAVGVPYENLEAIGMDDAGAVHIFYGTAGGLTAANHELWTDGIPETGDNYGFALTAGDFDNDGFTDLAIGTLNENVDNNTIMDAGVVNVLYGSATGLGYAHDGLFYQGAGGMADTAEAFDKFGRVLASGDLNGDGSLDLVVGIPDETLNDGTDDEKQSAGAIHVIYGSGTNGLHDAGNKLWWQGTQRRVHALLTDGQREETLGTGNGALFTQIPSGEPLTNHVASVTKVMTLLLAAEALEAPMSAFALDDEVTISALAAGTGGSRMANAADEVLATNDVMRLELLLYGMMLRSCNKSSVAIAQHFTGATEDFNTFSNWMNLKASELSMTSTLYTHPAGGCITTPQDQVNLWLDGWQYPLFRQISTDRYYTGAHACGEDAEGDAKCFFGMEKLGDSGYPGLEGWKGGNGRLGPALGRPSCTSSLLGQATRLDRTLVVSLHQTGDRWGDNDRLLDYGYRYLFTPDNRGANVLAGTVVSDFAVRRVTDTVSVTAVIDGQNNLRLDTWQAMASLGQVEPLAGVVVPVNDLAKGTNTLRATLVDMTPLPTVGQSEGDYLTGYLSNGQLRLDVWRVAAEPGY